MSDPLPPEVEAELIRFCAPDQREGDVTVTMAADLWGISAEGARRRLNKMVKSGVFERIENARLANNRKGLLFRPIGSQEI